MQTIENCRRCQHLCAFSLSLSFSLSRFSTCALSRKNFCQNVYYTGVFAHKSHYNLIVAVCRSTKSYWHDDIFLFYRIVNVNTILKCRSMLYTSVVTYVFAVPIEVRYIRLWIKQRKTDHFFVIYDYLIVFTFIDTNFIHLVFPFRMLFIVFQPLFNRTKAYSFIMKCLSCSWPRSL